MAPVTVGEGWRSTYEQELIDFDTIDRLRQVLTERGGNGWQCTAMAIDPTGQGYAVFSRHVWIAPTRKEEKDWAPLQVTPA